MKIKIKGGIALLLVSLMLVCSGCSEPIVIKVVAPTTENGIASQLQAVIHNNHELFEYPDPEWPESPTENYTTHELAVRVLESINQVRVKEGNMPLIFPAGMCTVALFRSKQIIENFAHDIQDIRLAHKEYQYGKQVDLSNLGFADSYNYYTSETQESIGCFQVLDDLDEQSATIVRELQANTSIWNLLTSPSTKFTGIGCTHSNGKWYVCIMAGENTYG